MFSRRNFIRLGAASVGTLALRRFAEIPALAQTGSNYRALVCVFLFGGNDSNNTIVPTDDANYKAYLAARDSLALQSGALTQVESASGAPYGFYSPSTSRRRCLSLIICFRTRISSSNGKPRSRKATARPVGAAAWPIMWRRRG